MATKLSCFRHRRDEREGDDALNLYKLLPSNLLPPPEADSTPSVEKKILRSENVPEGICLSPEVVYDLLAKLLACNPVDRLNAREALSHRFFAHEPKVERWRRSEHVSNPESREPEPESRVPEPKSLKRTMEMSQIGSFDLDWEVDGDQKAHVTSPSSVAAPASYAINSNAHTCVNDHGSTPGAILVDPVIDMKHEVSVGECTTEHTTEVPKTTISNGSHHTVHKRRRISSDGSYELPQRKAGLATS